MQTMALCQALVTRLGRFPERVPLTLTVGPTIDEGASTRVLITYGVEAGGKVSAWLLMPQGVAKPGGRPAYASMARILADEQLAGRLQIRPRAVFTSSEVLTEETRQRIVEAWGERLFNQYAATECGSLAAECNNHRGMHLSEDLVIIEVVDYNNRPMPPGVYGDKLLITVLFNRTQPLIRYELSDSVRLATNPCPSGHPFALIDDIQERVEDVLSFPGAADGVVNVHPLVFSRILDTIPVSGWQMVQEADVLHVLLSGVRGEFGDEMLADTLRQALAEQGAIIPRVEVQRVESIPKTAAGKSPLIKSNLSQAEISPSARTSELTR